MYQQKRLFEHPLFWSAIFLLVSCGITALYYADWYETLDQAAFSFAVLLHNPALTFVMKTITHLGGSEVLVPLGVVLVVGFFACGYRIEALIILVTLVIGDRLQDFTKELFARPRPTGINLIELPDSFAFPSGHAMVGLAFYGMLAYLLRSNFSDRSWAAIIQPVFLLLIFLICASRVYLGVHYISDVIAGLSYSAVWYFVVRHLYDLSVKRWRTPRYPRSPYLS
jgi:membrane-associated phospholipid phosphatase